jgi:uncharacterized protein (UPF0147 family)
MSDQKIQQVVELLGELSSDSTIPKNVKSMINQITEILNQKVEMSMRIDKVMHIFDQMNDDPNIDPFTRTQLWNVVSMLESI